MPRLLDDAEVERQMEAKRAEIQAYRQSRIEMSERRERDRRLRNTLKALHLKLYEQMQVCADVIIVIIVIIYGFLVRLLQSEHRCIT